MSFRKTWWVALLVGFHLTAANVPPPATDLPSPGQGKVATAVLSGGCFWGVEAVFERLKGVLNVVAGYAGGKAEEAHYETVGSRRTRHAESVMITYDPSQISYGKLLQVFFAVAHDPTQIDRQGPDFGPQYRSVIFYANDAQKKVAQAYITQIERARVFRDPIATQVSVLPGFFPAEESHQHFLQRNPNNPYIVQNDLPKLKALETAIPRVAETAVKMDPHLERGIALFNHGEYFECHEVLEVAWTPERGARRLFLQSLIHMAVGFYHSRRGNRAGATRQLRKGLRKLGAYLPVYERVDTARLEQDVLRVLAAIENGVAVSTYPGIHVD